MRHYPFRDLRQVVTVLKAECQLLLAVEGLEWSLNDQAAFFVLDNMTASTMKNSISYSQMWVAVLAWHRYFKRLIETLPTDSPLRASGMQELGKIESKYPEVVEVKVQ